MTSLTEFLLARIAEDEAAAPRGFAGRWHLSRFLADADVKRQIVKRATTLSTSSREGHEMMRLVASVYSDHPDYREEWRPDYRDEEWKP